MPPKLMKVGMRGLRVKTTIPSDNPPMWLFLDGLHDQMTELRIENVRDQLADTTPRKKCKDRALGLQKISGTYVPALVILHYLTGLSHMLHF